MKIRNGFVSNSSSSSFICKACSSEIDTGYDGDDAWFCHICINKFPKYIALEFSKEELNRIAREDNYSARLILEKVEEMLEKNK